MTQPRYTIDHVQITVPRALEADARRFYAEGLGFTEVPKPPELAGNGGAWFQVGAVQMHLSPEDVAVEQNHGARRHIAYEVDDLPGLERLLRRRGLDIIADKQPAAGMVRFYLCDPGGNRIEIFQRTR